MFKQRRSRENWTLSRLKACLVEFREAVMAGRAPMAEHLAALGDMANLPRNSGLAEDLSARASRESGRVTLHVMLALLQGAKLPPDTCEPMIRALSPHRDSAGLAWDLAAYLTTAQAIRTFMTEAKLERASADSLALVQADLLRVVGEGRARFGDVASLNILEGSALSLTDREAATSRFRAGTAMGHHAMATSGFDVGAHTYLTGNEVTAEPAFPIDDGCAAAVRRAFAGGPGSEATADLLWSVDVGFLRIYGPYWFNLAPYLMREGLGLVMGVIGEPAEVAAAIDESREMIVHLARFHRLPNAEACANTFIFVPMPLPSGVGQAKTFYACARHLMAPELMAMTGRPVLLMDADFAVRDPIEPFVRKLSRAEVGAVRVNGITALWPWRRNTAANGWFTPTDLGRSVLADIGAYVRAGLSHDPSWTLDQNALTYALERHADAPVMDVGALSRPTSQDKIRRLFEDTWRDGRTH